MLYIVIVSAFFLCGGNQFSRVTLERSRRIAKAMCQLGQVAQLRFLSLSPPLFGALRLKSPEIPEN